MRFPLGFDSLISSLNVGKSQCNMWDGSLVLLMLCISTDIYKTITNKREALAYLREAKKCPGAISERFLNAAK